jgi:glycogen phosphorylase/synthase
LENEIAPLFYFRDDDDVPTGWVRYIKNCIAKVSPNFTTTRMLKDYNEQYYGNLYKRSELIRKDDFELAKDLSSWKKKVFRAWESIEVISVKSPDISKEPIVLGKNYFGEVILDLNELSADDIGVEIVIAEMIAPDSTEVKVTFTQEFKLVSLEGKIATYRVDIVPVKTGAYDYGIRIFPKNASLPHKQDFNLVKWI